MSKQSATRHPPIYVTRNTFRNWQYACLKRHLLGYQSSFGSSWVHIHTCYAILSLRRRHIHFPDWKLCLLQGASCHFLMVKSLAGILPPPSPPHTHTTTLPSMTNKRVRNHFHLYLRQMEQIFLLSWMMLYQILGMFTAHDAKCQCDWKYEVRKKEILPG